MPVVAPLFTVQFIQDSIFFRVCFDKVSIYNLQLPYCCNKAILFFIGNLYSNGDYSIPKYRNGSLDEDTGKSTIFSHVGSVDSGKPPSGLFLPDMDTIDERHSENGLFFTYLCLMISNLARKQTNSIVILFLKLLLIYCFMVFVTKMTDWNEFFLVNVKAVQNAMSNLSITFLMLACPGQVTSSIPL